MSVLLVARKEFEDLLSSRLINVTIVIYLVLVSLDIYTLYSLISTQAIENICRSTVCSLLYILTKYGALVGIIIGVSSISAEFSNKSLNVLLSKPLYRDSIINGKLIGSLLFLICVFCLVVLFYTSGLFLFCGDAVSMFLVDFLIRIPVGMIISVVYVMIFLLISMFITLIVREQSFSVVLGIIAWSFLDLIRNVSIADNIALIFSKSSPESLANQIACTSPQCIIDTISTSSLYLPSINIPDGLSSIQFDFFKLILYLVITTVCCYVCFLRSDV